MPPVELLDAPRLTAPPLPAPPAPRPPRARRLLREQVLVLLVTASTYLVIGCWLALGRHVYLEDAWARLANGSYVVRGRDPHLAAVGFVWNPLPSLAMTPLVLLRPLVPALVTQGLAAVVTTALAMAGAVFQVHGLLRDTRMARPGRLVLTALFALNPMIAWYGVNGMSEAWLLLALAWAARRLTAWLREGRTSDLAVCGWALGLAYLSRYEAVAAAAAVPLLVVLHSRARAAGTRRHRWMTALTDAIIVALPSAVVVVGWAAVSWVIVGHPFETFHSVYGNSAQVGLEGGVIGQQTATDAVGRLAYVGEQVAWLAPALVLLVPMCLLAGLTRRGRSLLGLLGVFGSVLAFQAAAFVHGDTFGWLRFSIAAVPIGVLSAGLLSSVLAPRAVRAAVAVLAVGIAAASAITAVHPMLDHRMGREESVVLLPLLQPGRALPSDRAKLHRYENERAIARWLDGQHLPRGTVLVDTARGFAIVTSSDRPDQFVITSDRDFESAVADPAVSGVRYLLAQTEPQDAINIAYPGIYQDGRGFLRLVREFPAPGVGVDWRVYEVLDHY